MPSIEEIVERTVAKWNAHEKKNWRALKSRFSDDEKKVLAFLVKRVQMKEFGEKKAARLFHDFFPWRSQGSVRQRIRKALGK